MKYITYFKNSLKVNGIYDEEPIAITNNLALARCETIPQGDKFTVANLQDKTEKYTVQEPKEIVKVDGQGIEYPETEYIEVEKMRKYQTCDLVAEKDEKREIKNKIKGLKDWFNNNYRMYNEMLTRRQALGIEKSCNDTVRGKIYLSLEDLYLEAEKVVKEINELDTQLKENYYE